MDKNTIIGFGLILAILVGFSWLSQPSEAEKAKIKAYNDSISVVNAQQAIEKQNIINNADQGSVNNIENLSDSVLANNFDAFAPFTKGSNGNTILENEVLKLNISNKGGVIESVILKDYKNYDKDTLVLFDNTDASTNLMLTTAYNNIINTKDLYFTPQIINDSIVAMKLQINESAYFALVYTVHKNDYMVDFSVQSAGLANILTSRKSSFDLEWKMNIRQQERSKKFENRYSGLYYKYVADDVDNLSNESDDSEYIKNNVKWIANKDQFFSSIIIADTYFSEPVVESQISKKDGYLKNCKTLIGCGFDPSGKNPTNLKYYFGPNSYNDLAAYDNNITNEDNKLTLDELIPLGWGIFGWINKFLVIPLFDFLGSFISNYGIIILVLTIIIKLLLLPLTFKSYMSTAKMKVLRPQIEKINEKIPADKPMERQQATMALYRKVGVSPMGGCLPMLLQMPILFALFVFFPAAIELRQQSFLWASDLSSYDSIFSWTTQIPFISSYYGNHISLFCLLMTIANIISTRVSMANNPGQNDQMPMMKYMMYFMPIMFLFFFNDYASGLSYYYLISTLFTLLQTYIFRWSINDEKLLKQLEANKAKPAKKSKFMERLEKMQKQQAEMQRQQAKKRK